PALPGREHDVLWHGLPGDTGRPPPRGPGLAVPGPGHRVPDQGHRCDLRGLHGAGHGPDGPAPPAGRAPALDRLALAGRIGAGGGWLLREQPAAVRHTVSHAGRAVPGYTRGEPAGVPGLRARVRAEHVAAPARRDVAPE